MAKDPPQRTSAVRADLKKGIDDQGEIYTYGSEGLTSFNAGEILKQTINYSNPERILFNRDKREEVATPTIYPWQAHGSLIIQFPSGSLMGGSGTMVSQCHVYTAAHCVYKAELGGWAKRIQFIPARQGNITPPFGVMEAIKLFTTDKWTKNKDSEWDFGLIKLKENAYEKGVGFLGLRCLNDAEFMGKEIMVTGYPANENAINPNQRQGKFMWSMPGTITSISSELIYYDIDTTGGQSGGAVWAILEERPYCIGVHTDGTLYSSGRMANIGNRLSLKKRDILFEWMSDSIRGHQLPAV